MDHEGYGRSSRTPGFSTIFDGVEEGSGRNRFAVFGSSSGATRAGAFCNACPERVERLATSAFPWTGKDAPSLIERRERLAKWQATNRRPVGPDYYRQMLTCDVEGLTEPTLGEAVAAAELANGNDSVPNDTYVDMCIDLPLVDPTLITCPVSMIRAEHDGITTDEDNAAFYARLNTKAKHFVMMSG